MPDPTLEALKSGMAIVGIEAACIKTADKYYLIKTASEASIKGTVDSGENKPLRKGNRLLARHKTEDLITGYEISLSDLLVYPEVVALIDGGVVTNSEEGAFESYAGPVTGEEVVRTVLPWSCTAPTRTPETTLSTTRSSPSPAAGARVWWNGTSRKANFSRPSIPSNPCPRWANPP